MTSGMRAALLVAGLLLAAAPSAHGQTFKQVKSGSSSTACQGSRITSLAECSAAAAALGLRDTSATNDKQQRKSFDPPYCYFERGVLKFNDGSNTGSCSYDDVCLCRWYNSNANTGNTGTNSVVADPQYIVVTDSSSTCKQVTTQTECTKAGMGLPYPYGTNAPAVIVTDHRSPPHCYIDSTGDILKFNDGSNTGSCSDDNKCVCHANADDDKGSEIWKTISGPLKYGGIGLIILIIVYGVWTGVYQVSQREVIVVERFGRYHTTLSAGLSFIFPYIDKPKRFSYDYLVADANGYTTRNQKTNVYLISTQEEVIDFPKQRVISRDNAIIEVDAVLCYKITHPRTFIYSCINLPEILSKLLQAQLRNVAGDLELDDMIQNAACLNVLTGMLDLEASRWGVKVQFVKVQQVSYSYNPQILSLVKDTENRNKEIIIDARSTKQKTIIAAEGQRDKMIKEAEGQANERLSSARGIAQAIINRAAGEARNVSEISKALKATGEGNPTRYLLALKVLDVLKRVSQMPNTHVQFMPTETQFIQSASEISKIVAVAGARALR